MAVDPATGHEFAELPATSPAQVADLVDDARRALAVERDWRTPLVRAGALARMARLVEDQAGSLADLETRDTGKPRSQAEADVRAAVRSLDAGAGAIERLQGSAPALGPDALGYTVREPWGVCAQVIGWQDPLRVAARCAAPALAAGNAVILKPSALASITPLRLAQLAEEAGVPRGLFLVATGGDATGEALVRHPGTDHVTFVGSAATAARVAEHCARRLVPVAFEPSGKSAVLIFEDADLGKAVGAVARGGLQRLLVERSRFEAVTARVAQALAEVKLGPGIEDPDLGPLISERHVERAAALLEHARAGGARVLGGETDARFLRPALVTRVKADMEIFEADVPAPLVVAVPFDDERHALQLANAPAAGPEASVWTRDLARAHRVAAEVRAGRVCVNGSPEAGDVQAEAGLGYCRIKRVRVELGE